MTVERWAAIPGSPGYEASDQGRIRSFRRDAPPEGRILQPANHGDGYPIVRIAQEGGPSRQRFVHHLVLEAFVGPRPAEHVTRHLNDIKNDNRLENLAWGTLSENAHDRVRNGIHHWSSRSECSQGHEYTDENTLWKKTKAGRTRVCRKCHKVRSLEHKHRLRDALAKERAA